MPCQRRVQTVTLHVDPTRQPAVALYRKLGFVLESLVPDYYATGRDAARMVRELLAGS
jgi:ribosomal protein S18 acetylase RimI-like enzyme